MKLHLGLVIAAVLIASSAYSQHANVGIKGGLNSYNIYHENNAVYKSKIGFHVGLLWHLHMNEHVAFQPEVMYSLQGATLPDQTNLNLGYLNVPLLLQIMFGHGFRLEAGPQLGFLVNAKTELSGTSEDVRSNYKPLDAGLAAGLGFISASGLGLDVRYNYGFSNINDSGTSALSNRGFQVGLFYQFRH